MKRIKNTCFGILGATLLLFTSCNDEVSVENTNELSVDTFFTNLSQIEAAANGNLCLGWKGESSQ